ncbi:M67 family metallopeptidase [Aneurinibacillus danicus]|nr:M67 family metallopeptidase [Aneurinibacillus danicus]
MTEQVRRKMLHHCIVQLPYEACGLLSGKDWRATTLWTMDNVEKSPISFAMDTKQIEAVFGEMKKKGEELIGIYHSHPTAPPYPSHLDIAYAAYPDAAYIIVSLSGKSPEIGCFRIQNRQVTVWPWQTVIT